MEEQSDGSVIVSGLCTSDTVDLDDQIIDLDFSRKGLTAWAATFGNIRQMHSTNMPPAGKAIEIDTSRPDGVYLTARIVEPGAVKLVKEGVYSAFSVGISKPRIIRDKVAKQGRVTDGVFSEVSIVDFPALPTARFNIVKRSKTEIKKLEKTLTPIGTIMKRQTDEKEQSSMNEENIVKAEDAACATCQGTGKIKEGNVDCPDCATKVENAEVVKGSTECEACKGTGSVDDAECKKCMGKGMMESEIEKGNSDDEEKDDEDDDEEDDLDQGGDNEDEGDAQKMIEGISYALRRAHDATCDAYSPTVIASAHPSIEKNGYKAVLEPEVIRTLLSSIAETGEPSQIAALASAVGAATTLSTMKAADIEAARVAISKAFSDEYPDAHPTPGSITPGQFKRPYLTTGRTPSTSTGANPRIPVSNVTVDGDDFTRGPLTDGQESPSPENSGSHTPSNATAADQIAAATADVAMNALSALHDHIAAAYPTICTLDQGAGMSFAGVQSLSTDGGIRSIAAGATPDLTKAERKALKQAKALKKARKLLKKNGELPEETDTPEEASTIVKAVTTTDGDVLFDTDKLSEIVKTLIEQQTQEKFAEMNQTLSAMQSEVKKFSSEPDPAKAPVRGTVAVERAIEKAATEADVLRRTAEDGLKEQVAYLSEMTKSGNPELRMRAESQLRTLLEKVSFETE